MPEGPSPLVEVAADAFGDALRAVIRYHVQGDRQSGELAYVRDDVASERDDLESYAAALSRDYTFESIERDWHERLHDAGTLRASVRVFDSEAVVRLHDGVGAGYSVHVDPEVLASLTSFVETARAEVE